MIAADAETFDEEAQIFAVIMCGGSGTRLWPASRPSRPKQFIPLVGSETLFEQTVDRVCGIAGLSGILVVAGELHADLVSTQLARATVPTNVLLEPSGRDSGPAIAAAVAHVEQIDPSGVMVVVASDQYIPDTRTFCSDIGIAVRGAWQGGIVTLGIAPMEASSAFGYIRPGFTTGSIGPVEAFYEKPDRETAARYIEQGCLWNSGNFIARADTLAMAFEATSRDILDCARRGVEAGRRLDGGIVLGTPFTAAPKVSFDYAVMEKFEDRKLVRSTVAWSDLGAWNAVHHTMVHDDNGNSKVGDAVLIDAHNCHVRVADGMTVVASVVDGLSIIAEDDVIFISHLDRSQNVKKVVDALRESNRAQVDVPTIRFDAAEVAVRWRRWLDAAVFPLWWSNGHDHEIGLWRESLNAHDARPSDVPARARVQGRQAYVYARAGACGWPGPWQAALKSGLHAAESHYRSEDGLMHTLVGTDGARLSDEILLYDQTFILLALSQAQDVVRDAEQQALSQLDAIERHFRRTDGGRGFREAGAFPFQSNAHMHLLEAALAWFEAGTDPRWHRLADEIANLAADALVGSQDGLLREFYTADWLPAEGDDGRILEPGHHFEWAWLLSRWAKLSGEERFMRLATNLFTTGVAGLDRTRGVALLQIDDTLQPLSEIARLWSQTEWLKAAIVLAASSTQPDAPYYRGHIAKAVHAIDLFLKIPVQGLWHDKMRKDGSFVEEDVPASTLYHIVGAVEVLEDYAAGF